MKTTFVHRVAKRRASLFPLFGLVALMLLAACSGASRPKFRDDLSVPAVIPTRPADGEAVPLQRPDVANGAKIYAEKCLACHGVNGMGDGPNAARIKSQGKTVADLTQGARTHGAVPTDWHNIITNGRIENLMPPFSGSLSAQDRWDVQAYVWALAVPSRTITTGGELFTQQCASCHLGEGKQPRLDDLNWMVGKSLQQIANAMALGDAHKSLKLNDEQRFQLADYVRSLSYTYSDPSALRDAAVKGDGTLVFNASTQQQGPSLPMTGVPVTLRAYDQTGETFSRTLPLDANGVVTFTELPRRNDYFYQSEAIYDKVTFFAPPVQFVVTGTALLTETVLIYPLTSDPSVIRVPEFYYFVQDIREGELSIAEVYNFDNLSTQAYIDKNFPGGPRGLRIDLPEDAQNLRFDPPQLAARFTVSGSTVLYNDITEPGGRTQQIVLLYEIPYQGQKRIERNFTYAVSTTNVILPDFSSMPGRLDVSGLMDKGVTDTPNGKIHLYVNDKPLAANSKLAFDLSGQPRSAVAAGSDTTGIAFGAIGVVVALGMGYILLSRMRMFRAVPVKLEREQLLRAIAQLDDAFAKSEIDAKTYSRRREDLKSQLKDIWE